MSSYWLSILEYSQVEPVKKDKTSPLVLAYGRDEVDLLKKGHTCTCLCLDKGVVSLPSVTLSSSSSGSVAASSETFQEVKNRQ